MVNAKFFRSFDENVLSPLPEYHHGVILIITNKLDLDET